ncbi:metallophosphoesterase family protein [Paenibacillus sp. Soil522]|uniref:metallophosphoesterase family protein n=1 Tax=Paenibacillus sp. Soil522 TaxID=1736388 RepID=UPI0006F28A3A|nr:metallophosphoesterase [Paenibacillus sp. Soil522]KRE41799.1 phosphodiesterase [Paenibacillus sp. Soil522]
MKIVVVSDTHMPRMNKKLPDRLLRELKTAKAIIHAGDWTNLSVYEALVAFAPIYGVAGNNDGADIIRKFGLRRQLELEGVRMGIVHGHGDGKRINTEARALEAFKNVHLNVLIYGHSHIPVLKRSAGLLVFNPGSPTDKRRQPMYSFGIFQLAGGTVSAKHIFYNDKS